MVFQMPERPSSFFLNFAWLGYFILLLELACCCYSFLLGSFSRPHLFVEFSIIHESFSWFNSTIYLCISEYLLWSFLNSLPSISSNYFFLETVTRALLCSFEGVLLALLFHAYVPTVIVVHLDQLSNIFKGWLSMVKGFSFKMCLLVLALVPDGQFGCCFSLYLLSLCLL